eukprot:2881946-Prymnesium_polylepis.1
MELSPGACNYCGNPAPLHHYIACEDHVACENCAEHNAIVACFLVSLGTILKQELISVRSVQ